jgi:hypothetical protein
MINLIIYQSGKEIPEIMFQMSEKKNRDDFRKKEEIIMYGFNSIMVFIIILEVITVYAKV